MIDLHLGTIRKLAKLIETIRPGTCTSFVEELEKMRGTPEYNQYLVALYKDKVKEVFDSVKEDLLPSEIHQISEELLFDITDTSKWEEMWHEKILHYSEATEDTDWMLELLNYLKDLIDF